MQKSSLTHEAYTGKKGDRYEAKKPLDSDVFQGDGSFISKTQKEIDYVPKTVERYKMVKPKESEVWKVSSFAQAFNNHLELCQVFALQSPQSAFKMTGASQQTARRIKNVHVKRENALKKGNHMILAY